jgi:hypothetical protein
MFSAHIVRWQAWKFRTVPIASPGLAGTRIITPSLVPTRRIGWVLALVWALNKVDDPVKGGIKYDFQPLDPIL